MTATVSVQHITDVAPRFSPLFGSTWQPVCSCQVYRGCHYESRVRALQAAREHKARREGKRVTAK